MKGHLNHDNVKKKISEIIRQLEDVEFNWKRPVSCFNIETLFYVRITHTYTSLLYQMGTELLITKIYFCGL